MPTSADLWAVDTSVAVAALDAGHAAHDGCLRAVKSKRPGLAGHAAFETFSVLTRMPGQLRIDPPTAASLLQRAFPRIYWLDARSIGKLVERFGVVGVNGGSVYDALVGEAARQHHCTLLTRDQRARRTYDLLGVAYELID